MTQPQSDVVLWRGAAHQRVVAAFVTALLALLFMLTILLNPTARPEKQINGYGWIWYGLLLLAVAVAVNVFLSIRMEVRRSGFYIAYGLFNWPRHRIRWDRVEKVQQVKVRARDWGGYGFRWSPLKKGSGVILRNGPGLQFDLVGNRIFVVTTDDAAKALDVIDRLLNPHAYHDCGHDH